MDAKQAKALAQRPAKLRMLMEGTCVDHTAIVVRDLVAWETLFRCMGFEVDDTYRPRPRDIDKGPTSMHTVVVSAGGTPCAPLPAQFALMEGIDCPGKDDQITAYANLFGEFVTQHIALRIQGDIFFLAELWRGLGIRFVTEHDGAHSPFLLSEKDGHSVVQAFTYPMAAGSGRFFEIKKVLGKDECKRLDLKDEFRDKNVAGLRARVRSMQRSGKLFRVNIFGEKGTIRESLLRRGISVPSPYPTQLKDIV